MKCQCGASTWVEPPKKSIIDNYRHRICMNMDSRDVPEVYETPESLNGRTLLSQQSKGSLAYSGAKWGQKGKLPGNVQVS